VKLEIGNLKKAEDAFSFPRIGNAMRHVFQALENLDVFFPRLGQTQIDFSKPWKTYRNQAELLGVRDGLF
jgi:hypothetical protein